MALTEIALLKWQTNENLVLKTVGLLFNFLVAFETNQEVTLSEIITDVTGTS